MITHNDKYEREGIVRECGVLYCQEKVNESYYCESHREELFDRKVIW